MELLRELGDLLHQRLDLRRQRRDLRFEHDDPRVLLRALRLKLRDPRVFPRDLRLELRDSIVAPVPRHTDLITDPRSNGKRKNKDGTIWSTYAGAERLLWSERSLARRERLEVRSFEELHHHEEAPAELGRGVRVGHAYDLLAPET